jgi:hypothetical protein
VTRSRYELKVVDPAKLLVDVTGGIFETVPSLSRRVVAVGWPGVGKYIVVGLGVYLGNAEKDVVTSPLREILLNGKPLASSVEDEEELPPLARSR